MSLDTIIFAGPTINREEGVHILPQAVWHDSVACGDIIRVLRLKPRKLIIIDGYFALQAAVWHKEILMALERGVEVHGASSMGALRAAELADYGMQGYGEIYQLYKSAQIIADDEVAIIHDANYRHSTTALINDRFTLVAAVRDQIITQAQADELLQRLKCLPYFQRSLFVEGRKLQLTTLLAWLEHAYIDQKKIDALGLLSWVAAQQATPAIKIPSMTHTFFSNKIYREIASAPFKKAYAWLPESELALLNIEADTQPHLIRLTRLHMLNADIVPIATPEQHAADRLAISFNTLLRYYLIYSAEYEQFKAELAALESGIEISAAFKMRCLIVEAWRQMIAYVQGLALQISPDYQQLFINNWRKAQNLLTLTEWDAWLRLHDLTVAEDLAAFIYHMTLFYFLVEKNNVAYLGVKTLHAFDDCLAKTNLTCFLADTPFGANTHTAMEEYRMNGKL